MPALGHLEAAGARPGPLHPPGPGQPRPLQGHRRPQECAFPRTGHLEGIYYLLINNVTTTSTYYNLLNISKTYLQHLQLRRGSAHPDPD